MNKLIPREEIYLLLELHAWRKFPFKSIKEDFNSKDEFLSLKIYRINIINVRRQENINNI